MTGPSPKIRLGAEDIAEVLENIAALMEELHRSDEALQHALSSFANGDETAPTLFELQHVDLLTQSHFDIAKLSRVLADWAKGGVVTRDTLRASLTLRSLQDKLIDAREDTSDSSAGELSLF